MESFGEENGNIDILIQNGNNNKRKNQNKEEKMLFTKLNEKNVEIFLKSQLSQERKMRILSKLSKLRSGKNMLETI